MASEKARAPKRKHPRGRNSKPTSQHAIKKKGRHNVKSSINPNRIPLGKNKLLDEKKKKDAAAVAVAEEKKKKKNTQEEKASGGAVSDAFLLSAAPAAQQLRYFLHRFQSANGFKLSPLELESYRDTFMVELSEDMDQDVDNLSKHMKFIFGTSWRELLCDGKLSEGRIDAGSPSVIIISTSALRSLELLRGLKTFTTECRPVKLFAKHMKVEEQITLLKARVNIASGTPSRIKKLIDMDALLLSRLALIVLDMHQDSKGYSLFTLPQVSAEFWDLYNSHFHQRVLQGDTRICFYGPIPSLEMKKAMLEQ